MYIKYATRNRHILYRKQVQHIHNMLQETDYTIHRLQVLTTHVYTTCCYITYYFIIHIYTLLYIKQVQIIIYKIETYYYLENMWHNRDRTIRPRTIHPNWPLEGQVQVVQVRFFHFFSGELSLGEQSCLRHNTSYSTCYRLRKPDLCFHIN